MLGFAPISGSPLAVTSGGSGGGGGGSTVTDVAVSPGTATGSTTFSAVVNGTGSPSQSVNWTTTAGSINSSGVFVAPAQTGSVQTITVTATSQQNGAFAGTATVTISGTAGQTFVSAPRRFTAPGRIHSFTSPARTA